ncbi:MAG: DPP IV N-terminal domain-containing protein [Candidatus Aminicenantes bacterium]|nr:DPP IV N-terminal domain-containing protein [Candidatus Aminicenantes bacterium]
MDKRSIRNLCPILIVLALLAVATASAQTPWRPAALTAADYAKAEKMTAANLAPLVLRMGVRPAWLAGDRFWYRVAVAADASSFVLVDPAKKRKGPAFDAVKLAVALSKATGKNYDSARLPFTSIELSPDGGKVTFTAEGKRWAFTAKPEALKEETGAAPAAAAPGPGAGFGGSATTSPDGKLSAFIRNDNLWLKETATGTERPLTNDGVKDFGYATDNAGWTRSDRPVLLWSPDSKKIATFQQDQRGVGEMYLVETKVGHPVLQAWKYPLPGDPVVTTIQRVIIAIDGPKVVRLQIPPDQHRSTFSDDIKGRGGALGDAEWTPDSKRLIFVSSSRDHKKAWVRSADPETGAVKELFEETAATYFESGHSGSLWRLLGASNEILWFSERSGWGQMYLYDAATGKLKNAVTSGEGLVTLIVRIDEKARRIFFLAQGREKGRDPYFRHLYRVGLDGKGLTLLTPDDADHEVTLAPSGKYLVDAASKPDVAPTTTLRDADGKLLLTLEKADIAPLLASGWKPCTPFTVKARDVMTDIYGLMFRPTDFDANKKYPIVVSIYPGPQSGSIGGRSFAPVRGDTQSLAELGFIVVQIDGMGTPGRSKAFHDAYYANMGDNTLPDQVAAIKQLAAQYPWIDIDRVGIYGHSGGGYATCDAMFRYPDFFKVGVSQAGNHDQREYEDDWGEKWQGLLTKNADGTTSYDDQANQNHAAKLKGKLLLAHGTTDGNVPPYNTLLVVDALIKANKDFDLILFPNRSHGFGGEAYMVRRRWDYFVKNLLGAEPPKEYTIKPAAPRGPGR